MLDDAHQRRARAVVLGDAERVRDLLVGEPQHARADRRRGERIPRARRMHRRRARVERDARARADLVAEQHEAQELVPIVERKLIRERERGRDHGDADVSLAQRMAVVRIVAVDDRRARHRGAGNADAPSVENQPRAAALAHSEVARDEAAHDAGDRQLRSRERNAQRVEEAAPGLVLDLGGGRGEAQLANEARDIGRDGRDSQSRCAPRP